MSHTRQTNTDRASYAWRRPVSVTMVTDNGDLNRHVMLIADDHQPTLDGYLRACEAVGLRVAAAGIGDDAFELATTGIPGVIAISLALESGLTLLQRLARDPRTSSVPVIVTACQTEHLRTRAEQCGSVAIFLERHQPETLVSAANAILNVQILSDGLHREFPARCPHCDQRAGMPRSVSTVAVSGTYVGLECAKCGQPVAHPAAR